MQGSFKSDPGKSVNANGRSGKNDPGGAFNGTHSKLYYHTPTAFFKNTGSKEDSADTSRGAVYVLDGEGNVRHVVASGTRIRLPEISGIGALRTRYPIMPTHQEGSATWKELEALKDLVMNPDSYKYMMYTKDEEEVDEGESLMLRTSASTAKYGSHVHYVTITNDDVRKLKNGERLRFVTTEASGHTHTLTLRWRGRGKGNYIYTSCSDDASVTQSRCWDGHRIQMHATQ